jgi:hypothetical protein
MKCKYAAQAHQIMEQMKEKDSDDDDDQRDVSVEHDSEAEDEVRPAVTHTSSTVSRQLSRARRPRAEEFGRVYSHASHHYH